MADGKRVDNPIDALSKIIQSRTKIDNERNKLKETMLLERLKQKDKMADYMTKQKFQDKLTGQRSQETYNRAQEGRKEMYDYKAARPKYNPAQQKVQRTLAGDVPDIDESQLQISKETGPWWNKKTQTTKVRPEVIQVAQRIKTVRDLVEFLNNAGPLKKKFGEESVSVLFEHIQENVLPNLTIDQQQYLEKNKYITAE